MKIYSKILATTLPVVLCFFFAAVGITTFYSYQALSGLAERWLATRMSEAMRAASEQEEILHTYGLEEIPASIAKAKLDAGLRMTEIQVGREGYIFAVDKRGLVVVHPNPAAIGQNVSGQGWFKGLTPGRGRLTFLAGDVPNLAIYDYFAPWEWFVLAVDPEYEVYGALDRLRPTILTLGMAGAGILALALMVLTRRLTRPLRALTDGAQRIGEGALATRIAIRSKDEFGQLATVFNLMAANLQETHTALQHREEHFRALIENASDIVTILDADGLILYHSPSTERLLGYTRESLQGKSVFDFVHPDDCNRLRQRFEKQLRAEASSGFAEIRFRHQDGRWRTLETSGQNLIDHPAVGGIVVNARDITLRKQAEEALREANQKLEQRVLERTRELRQANRSLQREIDERQQAVEALQASEKKMRAILRASPVGIGLVIDRQLDWASDALYRILGYDEAHLIGRTVEFLYPDRGEYTRVGRKLHANLSSTRIGQVETRLVRGDGEIIDCTIRAFPLDTANPALGQIITVSDTSEAKRLEAELQRARKMEAIGTLAGGVAHDLNNILSGIVSYPELLLLDLPGESPLREPIKTIKASGERAAAIVQDLLTMARRGVAVTETVNLNTIVSEQLQSLEFCSLEGQHPAVRVTVDLARDLLNIKGSAAHLAKTVLNLLINALEAMPKGGRLHLATGNVYIDQPIRGYEHVDEGDYACLTVSDTGTGIPEADRDRIFEPFYTKKVMGRSGTGLGMAVVWGTVKDHNGYIGIDSAEGRGTTFKLFFPVLRGAVVEEAPRFNLEACRGAGESILVVDDVELQRQIATRILEKLGYRVASVASGEAALEHVRTHRVDLIVLDMIMAPGMDGLDTYRHILNINPSQKAIIASGFSETERVREAQALGAGPYVKKPYTIEKIGLAVKETLAQASLTDAL